MSKKTYDLLVVGSGPGGQTAAITAAKLGKRVGIIERKPCLGGVSLQTGTIPSKALREAAFLASRFSAGGMREHATRQTMGRNFLAEAIGKKDRIVKQKEVTLLKQLLQQGVSIIPGEASFHDTHTLVANNPAGQSVLLQAEKIILATGSRPRRPQHIPFDKERVLDSTSILKLKHLPSSLLVVGGGVIACEFATIFAPLGVAVTIIDSHQQLLAYLDKDIADNLAGHMLEMGIQQYMNSRVNTVQRQQDKVVVEADTGQQFTVDTLLYAQGRQPNYDNLHIERAGLINDDNGWVRINEAHQTSAKHIYIIGDLAGNPALASTAMQQGVMVARHAFAQEKHASDTPLPMAIYTIPELSYVGETERQLQQRQVNYVSGTASYADSARGQIIGEHHGMLKLLVERSSHQILGVHIIGESASELIHIAQLAMACSCTVDRLADNIFNYPTLAECYKTAAMSCMDQL
jgi:NAD(P) transhydrogenase